MNQYKDIFISENKDYIIEMTRKELTLFRDINSSAKFMCELTFKNNIGIVLRKLVLSDIDISILLDNIYNFLEINQEMFFMVNSSDTTCNNSCIRITLDSYIKDGYNYYIQYFKLYNYNSESMDLLFQFDISDNLVEFIDKLYNLYIFDSNIENKYRYDPSNWLE